MEPDYYCPACGGRVRRIYRRGAWQSCYKCAACDELFFGISVITRTERDRRFPVIAMKHPTAAEWSAMGEPCNA